MQFSEPNSPVFQADSSDALHLPPAPLAIQAAKPRQLTNGAAGAEDPPRAT
jgi:hypothetical protein